MGYAKKIHQGLRRANPMFHGKLHEKPKLGPLNISQLKELAEKAPRNKDRAKYLREIIRKELMARKAKAIIEAKLDERNNI